MDSALSELALIVWICLGVITTPTMPAVFDRIEVPMPDFPSTLV